MTKREWHWIKEIAGVRPADFAEAVRAGDQDVEVAMAVITLVRAGKAPKQQYRELAEFFLDSEGEMTAETEEEEESPPSSGTPPPTGSTSSEKRTSSGEGSNNTGDDLQATDLASIGQLN